MASPFEEYKKKIKERNFVIDRLQIELDLKKKQLEHLKELLSLLQEKTSSEPSDERSSRVNGSEAP